MKKKLVLLCVLCLLIGALAVGANAAPGDPTITVGTVSGISGKDTTEIEVPISIENNPGFSSFTMTLTYDTTKLTATGVTPGAIGPTGGNANTATGTQLSYGAASNTTGDNVLFSVKFNIADDATEDIDIAIALANGGLFNEKDEAVEVDLQKGKVTITHNHSDAPAGSAAEGSEGWTAGTAATCLTAGTESYVCTYCNEAVERDVDALGHDMTEHAAVPHTCEKDGDVQYWSCSNCGKNFSDNAKNSTNELESVVDPAAHTFGEGTKTEAKASDCTNYGNNAYWACSVCSKVFKDVDGAADPTQETSVTAETLTELGSHVLTKTEAKAATCTEDGNNEYWTCSACNNTFGDENAATQVTLGDVTLPKLDHKNATYVAAAKPSKSEEGALIPGYYEHFFCPDCYTYFKVVTEGENHSIDTVNEPYGVATFAEDDTNKEHPIMPEALLINKVSGDANEDGEVNARDVTRILRYLAGTYTSNNNPNLVNSDVNGDGEVNARDVTRILRYLAGTYTSNNVLE